MSAGLSRRGFFAAFRRRLERKPEPAPPSFKKSDESSSLARTAVIQGRFCLALTSFCAVCVERCPVPGAMVKERGMPMVVADVCTGCGVCHDVCPAPRNAVLLMPRRSTPSPQPA